VSTKKWNLTIEIARKKASTHRHFQKFHIQANPDEYILDIVERVWAFQDRSLTFRHACHHSTCGACAMIVNGVERLTCITPVHNITKDMGVVRIEPLRNFPVLSDLVVDMSKFYMQLEKAKFNQVASLSDSALPYENVHYIHKEDGEYERLVDCIECGMCVSACPSAMTSSNYFGPAALAAVQQTNHQTGDHELLRLVDCQDGAWRCHSAYECSEVCPSNVNPAWRIMNLRRRILSHRIRQFFLKG
jgi:succinate dehydrogenase / fumarate reductase iron-sulfur subunit